MTPTFDEDDRIHDVVQIGYGPVGQALALALGTHGSDVVVFERHLEPFGLSRAGHIDHEVMRILQVGGVARRIERELVPVKGFTLMDADLVTLSEIAPNPTSMSGWSPEYMIYQPVLESALVEAVAELPSVAVHWGHEAIALVQHPDYVIVTVRAISGPAAGTTYDVRAKYVVGVDGANSAVRNLLGKTYDTDFGFTGPWLVCDFKHHDPDVDLGWEGGGQVLDIRRPTTTGRWLGRRHSRVEFMLMPGETEADFQTEESVWPLAAKFNLRPDRCVLERHAIYTFRSLLVDDWRDGRVLLAGDAAHLMPPFLGQGMCSGFRDAQNLAWKLDLVLRGAAEVGLLDSYTLERREHVSTIIQAAVRLGGMVATIDAEQGAMRDAMLSQQGAPPPVPPLPGLDSGILRHPSDANAAVGRLGLQARVTVGDQTGLLDDVVGAGWHVLTRRPIGRSELSTQNIELLDLLDAALLHITPAPVAGAVLDVDFEYNAWFDRVGVSVVVIRPDHYVYATATDALGLSAALDDLADHLQLTRSRSLADA